MTDTLSLIESFQVKRACEVSRDVLESMKGPMVDGIEQRNIIEIFTSSEYLKDDRNGTLASFVVMSPDDIPLAFFSVRCGELFKETEMNKVRAGYDAYVALQKLASGLVLSAEDQKKSKDCILNAIKLGLSIDDFMIFYNKKKAWKGDDIMDANKGINRVVDAYPAVELKLFGVNEECKTYWKSLGLPDDKKLGECIFWLKIVDVIQSMLNYVGCQYLYLFAADKEPEGQLVQYYRVRLGFESEAGVMANKPSFDWESQFLFQGISSLLHRCAEFRRSFSK